MSAQGRLPILLSAGFVLVILGLAFQQLRGWSGVGLALGAAQVLLYLGWLVVESRVAVGELGQEETQRDRGTLEVYAAGRFCTVAAALALPGYPIAARLGLEPGWLLQAMGLLVFLAGVALRLIAIRTLGRFYSHRVRQQQDHQIVDTGPYRLLRHPAYTGMLLAHLGFVLVFANPWAALLLGAFFAPAVIWRILVEERMLFQLPGYPEFAATRKRLVPWVW
ncbi:MAG: isoprenylcysteine carboxylmethyltransferase family protein [Planctomycetota bacterium]